MFSLNDNQTIILIGLALVVYLSLLLWFYGDKWFKTVMRESNDYMHLAWIADSVAYLAKQDGLKPRQLTDAQRGHYLAIVIGSRLDDYYE